MYTIRCEFIYDYYILFVAVSVMCVMCSLFKVRITPLGKAL